jgi:hypothetical protein
MVRVSLLFLVAAAAACGSAHAGRCTNQQIDLMMINDMNNNIARAHWPMIPTGVGGGRLVDLRGAVQDFSVLADNGGLLDCTLVLQRQGGQQTIRIRYWRNIAGQLYHQITAVN